MARNAWWSLCFSFSLWTCESNDLNASYLSWKLNQHGYIIIKDSYTYNKQGTVLSRFKYQWIRMHSSLYLTRVRLYFPYTWWLPAIKTMLIHCWCSQSCKVRQLQPLICTMTQFIYWCAVKQSIRSTSAGFCKVCDVFKGTGLVSEEHNEAVFIFINTCCINVFISELHLQSTDRWLWQLACCLYKGMGDMDLNFHLTFCGIYCDNNIQ